MAVLINLVICLLQPLQNHIVNLIMKKKCVYFSAIFNKRKSLFSFGTTGERKTFTEQTIPTRLGIMFPSNNKSPHLGPGTYNNEVRRFPKPPRPTSTTQ